MSYRFDRSRGIVSVQAKIHGSAGRVRLRMALDTGASFTLVNAAVLVSAGYDPAAAPERIQITTASGIEFVPRLTIDRFTALGMEKSNFQVLVHTLPPSTAVDGLLGLNFFNDTVLTIDFRKERISVD
jgi:predicted aspartyl protease